jgi:hypothetical protein
MNECVALFLGQARLDLIFANGVHLQKKLATRKMIRAVFDRVERKWCGEDLLGHSDF